MLENKVLYPHSVSVSVSGLRSGPGQSWTRSYGTSASKKVHPKVRNHGEGPYVKLGPQRNYHKGRPALRHYANQTARPL